MTRLLIVDDNKQNLYMLRVLLKGHGYEVVTAANGAEALEKARRDPPDVIVSDILMPVMDGFTLCRQWKGDERLKEISFVFYTATYTDPKDKALALSLGAERFIVKPVEPDVFVELLREVIAEHEAGRLVAPREPVVEEAVYLREYNEALICKLEDKMLRLEEANRVLEFEITERKRAEEALKKSEEKYQDLYNLAPDMFVSVDAQTATIIECNQTLVTALGYTKEEIIGRPIFDMYAPASARYAKENVFPVFAKTGEIEGEELQIQRKDRSTIDVSLKVSAVRDAQGNILHSRSIWRDITERKRAQEEKERLAAQVSAQARQVQGILDTVPQGVLLLDGDGRILQATPVAEKDLDILVGAQVGDVLTRLGDLPLAELLTSPPTKGLWHEVKADEHTFEVIARPVETGPAREHWVLVINDVTRERQIQAQLQQQERLAAVGQLAGGIAHDFNNIMAVIILYAQMLVQSEGLTERDREKVATITQQGWHATRLIQQILDFSRRAVLEQRSLDLLPLVKEQVKLLKRTLPERIEIGLAHREEEYVVSADLTRMQQMIMNLAFNARDAMPKGGTLRIGLEWVEVEPGRSPLLPEMEAGKWVRLTVSDTGMGIPPDVLPHIFEPFFTTKAPGKGSGLGLAQVHGIVGQHAGRIDVETLVGEGTTFTIYLPALAARPVEPPTPDISAVLQGRGEVVLVVEDGAALRTALVESLEQMNYQALEAANGEQALAVIEEHGERVALVLSDVVMPVMGGIALLHALRQKGWQTPVILLTGHPLEKELDDLRAQGVTAWLTKPPSIERLAQAVADGLRE